MAAQAIAKTLFSLPEYQNAKRISVYLSMPSAEVQSAVIVHDALSNGKRVFIPYCYKFSNPKPDQLGSTMDMLELVGLQDYECLKLDKWGIPTPSEGSIARRLNCFGGKGRAEGEVGGDEGGEAGLDLIVTPGLGFDRQMGRIGRGMSFYDNFFARCQTHSRITGSQLPWIGQCLCFFSNIYFLIQADVRTSLLVGLALNEQVLPSEQTVPMESTDKPLDALILGDGSVCRRSD
jgi:5-formyltetrahydrofolate cyclo-ligase